MIEQTTNPNQALWEKGDFTRIAETMQQSGEALVAGLGIAPGMHLLDLGCGDGTTAIPAARRGARVLGVDIARNLVEAGRQRAAREQLDHISFEHGDARQLTGLKDQTFDYVVSIFGAMFAPEPERVTQEMVRVAKPGGKIVMGNWIPGDPTLVAQILRISAKYTPPPPPGFVSPMMWGVESEVTARFGKAGIAAENIHFHKADWTFRFNGTPNEFVALFKNYYGPTMNAFEAAQQKGMAELLQQELEALFASHNASKVPNQTIITATYLQVVADVPTQEHTSTGKSRPVLH